MSLPFPPIMEAWRTGQPREYWHVVTEKWRPCNNLHGLVNCTPYRIAVTPDTIDWGPIDPQIKYIARHSTNVVYGFTHEPIRNDSHWVGNNPIYRINGLIASYRRGTCDWKDSLMVRP